MSWFVVDNAADDAPVRRITTTFTSAELARSSYEGDTDVERYAARVPVAMLEQRGGARVFAEPREPSLEQRLRDVQVRNAALDQELADARRAAAVASARQPRKRASTSLRASGAKRRSTPTRRSPVPPIPPAAAALSSSRVMSLPSLQEQAPVDDFEETKQRRVPMRSSSSSLTTVDAPTLASMFRSVAEVTAESMLEQQRLAELANYRTPFDKR